MKLAWKKMGRYPGPGIPWVEVYDDDRPTMENKIGSFSQLGGGYVHGANNRGYSVRTWPEFVRYIQLCWGVELSAEAEPEPRVSKQELEERENRSRASVERMVEKLQARAEEHGLI